MVVVRHKMDLLVAEPPWLGYWYKCLNCIRFSLLATQREFGTTPVAVRRGVWDRGDAIWRDRGYISRMTSE